MVKNLPGNAGKAGLVTGQGTEGLSRQLVGKKNPPSMQETQEMQLRFLGQEALLEEGMATHSSIIAWRIPIFGDLGAWRTIVQWVSKSQTQLSD